MHSVTHPNFFGADWYIKGQETNKCATMVGAEGKNFQNVCLQML